jgi:hypothetical protein
MFVLDAMMRSAPAGAAGCAMSFGPGMVAETMMFRNVGAPRALQQAAASGATARVGASVF